MTTRTEAGAEKSFVSTLLPWIVAAFVAVIYLLTVNHWLSFRNMQFVARATGQTWTAQTYWPVFILVTSPFRWLPHTWVPLAMNLFSVGCAFLALALLARCVALMPHDRTQKQRERQHGSLALLSIPTAWIPPVLAVLVCGLQLTFWERATVLSTGMFDLVLFAYCVRCLLEYRIDKRESWLLRAAVIYAAAATDNWVLIVLFPAFLAALIWIRGFTFFQLRFLARLFLCLLAGLLVYLYLPLVHLASDGYFWLPLKQNLNAEISEVMLLVTRYTPHHAQLQLVLTSLVPLLVIGIRWRSSFGDTSQVGVTLATWILHLAYAALLIACIGGAFDTGFGLRDAAEKFPFLDANRERFLPLVFLSALSIGYLSGYFLLVFKPLTRRGRRPTGQVIYGVSVSIICILLVLTPVGLLYKNVPAIRITNGPAMRNYASMLTEHLPDQAVVLSDNSISLLIAESWLARSGRDKNFIFLETHSLRFPPYYRYLVRKHPGVLPALSTNITDADVISDGDALGLLASLQQKRPVYYLQPSFGYYFEAFYPVPHGLTYELKRFSTNTAITPPPLTEAVFAENEAFWKLHDSDVRALLPWIAAPVSEADFTPRQRWMDQMHIPYEKSPDALELGAVYSRALNTWGVHAQRMGRLESAGANFSQALQLSPDNVVARANADFNKKLRNGERAPADNLTAFETEFGKYSNWQQLLGSDGLFDEPTGCLAEGIVFARGRLDREAAQNFERTLALAPDSVLARLWLARIYLSSREPAKAFPLIDGLKARTNLFADAAITTADVSQVELAAYYANKEMGRARELIQNVVSRQPPEPAMLDAVSKTCVFYRDYTNALPVVKKQLELNPNDLNQLINVAFIQIQMRNFDDAIPPLSKAISLQSTNSAALFCRADAYLESGKLDEAQHDYEALQKLNPKAYPVYHGLAEIAYRKKDTNAAIRYYELDLANVQTNSPEAKFATDRIKSLKPGAP
ncbi:MAG TPA: tetratricopeptide repeat protein [Verrucomicrobiae bacterium]|jgi:tetratricopeptide (TPR) repeat protein|nr:tetratricopeptide repeat protein [Verrucomicrobiae bacterium]